MNLYNIQETALKAQGYKIYEGEQALHQICFNVEMKKIYYDDGGFYMNTDYKGLIREDTGEVLYVGKEYSPIRNREIVEAMTPLFNDGFMLKDVRVYQDRKFQINLWNPDETLEINGQQAYLRATFGNSYDGSQSFVAALGAYIQVCSNGLTVGKGFALRKKHTGLSDLSSFMLESVHNRHKVIEKITSKDWDNHDQVKIMKLFDRITKGLPDGKDNKPNSVKVLLNQKFREEMQLYDNLEFALFMATTNLATHGHLLGVSPSYQMELETQASNVFFNN